MYEAVVDHELINNELKYNPEFLLNFSDHQNFASEVENGGVFGTPALFDKKPDFVDFSDSWNTSADSVEIPDFSDACIKFLGDILLEDGLDEIPATEQEYRALQATEKSLYDAIGERYTPDNHELVATSLNRNVEHKVDVFDGSCGDSSGFNKFQHNGQINFELKTMPNETSVEKFLGLDELANSFLQLNSQSSESSNRDYSKDRVVTSPDSTLTSDIIPEKEYKPVDLPSRKKDRQRDEVGYDDGRGNKVQASTNEDYVEMEEYDDVLLSREHNFDDSTLKSGLSCNEVSEKLSNKGSKGRSTRGKKSSNLVEEVDLRGLLNQCAQAVANFDLRRANERLKQVRQHSSPYGDSIERVSHYFANALEARIAGTGSTVTANIIDARISSSDFLMAYRAYVKAIPYQRMTYFLANRTIMKFAETAKKVHIIDFGILLGLQWPCLIQALSDRPGGPPELRITGVEFPQHRFRPAERVEATGRRLTGYCERFNVPFRYRSIAQIWNSIKPEDLKTESDEVVIVNCIIRSGTLLDETVEVDSSKDAFLKLVKQLNPKLFVHEVLNGTFSAPFFVTRFKETLFHYSALFEVFEATIPREDHARQLIESEISGKELLNIVACEGVERVQRPESYKQWQVRSARAGLKQLPLDRELFKTARATAKANYLKDFVVDEDKNWMLQGWKGRILCALSFWQAS
ncbi:scarecrow-like protein 30 [Silene latifolia]|uniref:scarecrow-like protein 30 n=1 Tax=Silene latifolia TaxID=37657 RepID=UPI003D780DBD